MQWWWESFRSEIFFFSLWQIFVILSCHFLTLPRDLTFSSKVYRWPQIKTIRILEWDLYSPNKYTSITIQFWQQSGQDRSWRREEGWALWSWEPRALQVHKCSSLPVNMQIRNDNLMQYTPPRVIICLLLWKVQLLIFQKFLNFQQNFRVFNFSLKISKTTKGLPARKKGRRLYTSRFQNS